MFGRGMNVDDLARTVAKETANALKSPAVPQVRAVSGRVKSCGVPNALEM